MQSKNTRLTDERTEQPLFSNYVPLEGAFDEFLDARGKPRAQTRKVIELLDTVGRAEFRARQKLADATFLKSGVTFAVYSDQRGTEKTFPFDLIPRVISGTEWARIAGGLKQRVIALNMFLTDVYGPQKALKDGIVPRYLVEGAKGFCRKAIGLTPPNGVYIHVAGIDLIRAPDGRILVLEDNVRTPSGVSYVIENRVAMKRVFPVVFNQAHVSPIEEYPHKLRDALQSTAPTGTDDPTTVVLTPGPFNSAFFEHSFLARRMGVPLVQGPDLFVDNDCVYAKTTNGPQRVDVIYRRIDDDFLDPEAFNKDSLLGVPGLVKAYAKGNVTLANAIGNGVADDKGIYPFVPDLIRYYLAEEAILEQVPTYICAREQDLAYTLEHLDELVVKSVNEAGGYGMLMGPQASKKQRSEFARKIKAEPRNFIAQPRVELSTCPTWTSKGIAPRRVDFRPYILTGTDTWVMPGGLTRVALVEGSYVVNSSQGGGSKDTWVLEEVVR